MNTAISVERLWAAPRVLWKIKDVVAVGIITTLCPITVYALLRMTGISREYILLPLFLYIGGGLSLLLPVLWVVKFYGVRGSVLGLGVGNWPLGASIFLGTVAGFTLFLFVSVAGFDSAVIGRGFLVRVVCALPWLLSVRGFAEFIVIPMGEEVFHRGFFYGYVRSKLGVSIGLMVQAVLFSIVHTESLLRGDIGFLALYRFVPGFAFGLIYQVSGSIYPSAVCHSVLNYLLTVAESG
jgi:membrane protease YdiL (CAAX protease family)